MGCKPNWTREEIEYLSENWGSKAIPKIAGELDRSVNAVKLKAQKLRLGAWLDAGDYVSLNQLMKALGRDYGLQYTAKIWIDELGLPVTRKRVNRYIFPKSVSIVKGGGQRGRGCREWYKNPEAIADGKRNTSSVEATVRKIGKRAGVENTHPHKFRRTSATFALRRGMPIEMVSKMLGHENLATTQIYLDLTEEELEAAHKKYVI